MNRLSKSITAIKDSYDVVVIGSGYGASIAAARFSRAGLAVCILERGREFQPGEYPATMGDALKEMQFNTDKAGERINGLYEFHISEDISVFKGCGLGGTSLVNANVAIKPEPRLFDDARWPSEIRNDLSSLNEAYDTAHAMLRPSPYPEGTSPDFPVLPKTEAMRKSAAAMGEKIYLPDINISFKDGVNHVGVDQQHCVGCGDCLTGCNHRAKNTLIMNYLPDAVNHGAEIFCEVHVSHVEQSADGWLVCYDLYHTGREKFTAPLLFVKAKQVVIGGGSLGSTELLLRSRDRGLSVSDHAGMGFTGNGDVLGFGYNCEDPVNTMGKGVLWNDPELDPAGPCITSVIDMRNKPVLHDGMTFEDGNVPGPLAHMMNTALMAASATIGVDTDSGIKDWIFEHKEEVESLVRGPYHGATSHTQTFLIMSHDNGKGVMKLTNDKLDISWPGVGDQPIFKKANDTMLAATKALGGTFLKNITWSKMMHNALVTVHPLGGCVMGDDAATAVTNHLGNVFSGKTGNATHKGLYVLDGAIVPLPLGTNPLFTISAVAERAMKLILSGMGKSSTYDFPSAMAKMNETLPGVQFTETMRGYFSKNEKADFQAGADKGKAENSPFMFTLTVRAVNIDNMVTDPMHTGSLMGMVIAPMLSAKPLTATEGIFNLFSKNDPNDPNMRHMGYKMKMTSVEGRQYYMDGYKMVEHQAGQNDMWNDTTTLYITVFDGPDENAVVLGKGILKILTSDFAIQMTTMTPINASSTMEGLLTLQKFSKFFSGEVADAYFKKLLG